MTGEPFTCIRCHKLFTRADNLKRHENQCINDAQIVCPFCESTFTRGDSLKRHLKDIHNETITPAQNSCLLREIMDMPQHIRQECEKLDANLLVTQLREHVLQGYSIKGPECLTILNKLRMMNIIE